MGHKDGKRVKLPLGTCASRNPRNRIVDPKDKAKTVPKTEWASFDEVDILWFKTQCEKHGIGEKDILLPETEEEAWKRELSKDTSDWFDDCKENGDSSDEPQDVPDDGETEPNNDSDEADCTADHKPGWKSPPPEGSSDTTRTSWDGKQCQCKVYIKATFTNDKDIDETREKSKPCYQNWHKL